ncbi:D-fructose-6-phosphate amidotransferase [Vibrio sp. Y2-5]|uniref:D-fructose-6-phosphate amidotransferase n=1 Tax=Vibrio TaxID=662 RepID=UPI00142D8445|nr:MULTISPECIES: D-fructose-6-phosphate amidotransferase [Vibrio]MBD0786301.1 D-fructose-6-phosphate amidotransferase [Vibrio sp. Y2-5]NIY92139.1 D-fructose-6-phosphate amidotransferase [Vibrio diazotrophicus]
MTTSKVILRNFLGLILIMSVVLCGLYILLDALAIFAYFNHEVVIANQFIDESFYLLIFFIPPYFIGKYINRPEIVQALEDYILSKSKSEHF